MEDYFHLSPDVTNRIEFVVPYVIDINGKGRGSMLTVERIESLVNGQETLSIYTSVLGTNGEVPRTITDLSKDGALMTLAPDKDSFKICPWSKDGSVAYVLCDTYKIGSNIPNEFNCRYIAQRQIENLTKQGFSIQVGAEQEFRLFQNNSRNPVINSIQTNNNFEYFIHVYPYARELKRQLQALNMDVLSSCLKEGKGLVSFSMKPNFGLSSLDKIWLFREAAKHAAADMNLLASFMSCPFLNEGGSSLRFNHSIWQETPNGTINVTVLRQEGQLSEIGECWTAGLIKHSKALSAFYLPTVNCYRRINSIAGGLRSSWGLHDQSVAYSVKTNKLNGNMNYIENNLCSSSANIYLAVAATIAAGIDGLKKRLKIPTKGNVTQSESLPKTLDEALTALQNDKDLVNELGNKFVEYFIKSKKETDIQVLSGVDVTQSKDDDLAKEIDKYLKI